MKRLSEFFHPGELEAQARFNEGKAWTERSAGAFERMFKSCIDDETAYFIEGQKYFFIATANARGECDCSFRGTEQGPGGLLQAVLVRDPKTLVFPDYAGNNLYNSLGNIIDNPHIGLLFIDFKTALRLRVNGQARIIAGQGDYHALWPDSLRHIEVTVQQAYFNCRRRIKESVLI